MNVVNTSQNVMKELNINENNLIKSFPEFMDIKNNFIYGEVWDKGSMENKLRSLITITTLLSLDAGDLEEQLNVALHLGVTPSELQEVFHQVAPYIGIARAEKGLLVLQKVFDKWQVTLPILNETVVEENRLEKGIEVQKEIFGGIIDTMRMNAPEDMKFIQDYLSAYCFGDTYTRNGLDLRTRELLTFVSLISLGGCDPQVKAHVAGNLAVGNGRSILINTVNQCLPYIGFPKALNAITAIDEITN